MPEDLQPTDAVPGVAGGQPPPTPGSSSPLSSLELAGYILAVVLPVFGLAVGIVLVNRPQSRTVKHGLWIIAISVVAGFLFFLALILYSHSAGAATEGG